MWSSARRTLSSPVHFRISFVSRFHSSIPITEPVFTRTRVVSVQRQRQPRRPMNLLRATPSESALHQAGPQIALAFGQPRGR